MAADPSRIVVIRHGETEWSAAMKHTGRTDVPLAPTGRRQAAGLAEVLVGEHFDRVCCSPMLRARQTCELAGFAARAELLADLVEWDYGEYEGRTSAEIRAERPGWNVWRDGCPGGEPLPEFGARVDRAIDELCSVPDTSVLVFAHGHLLRTLAARWIGMQPTGGSRFLLSPAALGILAHERETRTIGRWNAPRLR